jgi:DNA-binding transcriptional LysR family regulator
MPRNLDITALRSFAAVADAGGVTRAASALHLTQSAVSMQLKRLEQSLGVSLIDRSGRGVALTAEGDQLLSYARRLLALNDEAVGRMTAQEYEGEITLGVPHDIVYPYIPRGTCAMILTTEERAGDGGETLAQRPLVWIGAPNSQIWRARPVRLAFARHCIFRAGVLRTLERNAIGWEMAVDADSDRTIEATVSADLAITAVLAGAEPPLTEPVPHGGALPDLQTYAINLYVSELATGPAERALADLVREVYHAPSPVAS